MTCASCVRRVERALGKVPGVEGASVNLATEQAAVQEAALLPALLAAVERSGYHARLAEPLRNRLAIDQPERDHVATPVSRIEVGHGMEPT